VEVYFNVISRKDLLDLVRKAGFHRYRILNTSDLDHLDLTGSHPFSDTKGSLVICALSCYTSEPDDRSQSGDPHGLIAPFARSNYYRECVVRLQAVLREVNSRTGLKKGESRIFCNSRVPEQALAAHSGLGFYGRNNLIITPPDLGSLFVIAGLLLPIQLQPDSPVTEKPSPGDLCGSCRACIDACPVSALSEDGGLDADTCLQNLATSVKSWPDDLKELWGARIYGCQICQAVCPFNQHLVVECRPARGRLGPSIPLRQFLEPPPDQLRQILKKTTLGQSWIPAEALQRNALVAAGNQGDSAILPYITPYLESQIPFLREAASWTCNKIRQTNL
jgi:epoxyqueuosine reductase